MIVKCKQSDVEKLISYIDKDYSKCLYLYLNLKKYGLDSDIIDAFIQYKDDEISSVMLKYYSCMHIYSKNNDFDADEISDFLLGKKLTMLYCPASTAEKIMPAYSEKSNQSISISKGWVAKIASIDKAPKGLAVRAQDKDFEQIVRLIYDDEDIGRSYNYDELSKQLQERNKDGYSRNIVIKNNDLVIAHACTNAEYDDIAVVAELLVRKEYRRQGYASEIWRDICRDLLNEGKEVFSFYYSEESRSLHKKIGFDEVCEWGKIVIS